MRLLRPARVLPLCTSRGRRAKCRHAGRGRGTPPTRRRPRAPTTRRAAPITQHSDARTGAHMHSACQARARKINSRRWRPKEGPPLPSGRRADRSSSRTDDAPDGIQIATPRSHAPGRMRPASTSAVRAPRTSRVGCDFMGGTAASTHIRASRPPDAPYRAVSSHAHACERLCPPYDLFERIRTVRTSPMACAKPGEPVLRPQRSGPRAPTMPRVASRTRHYGVCTGVHTYSECRSYRSEKDSC